MLSLIEPVSPPAANTSCPVTTATWLADYCLMALSTQPSHNAPYKQQHLFNSSFSETTQVCRYQKGKIQFGFYWHWVTVVSAAPRSKQITMPASHHQFFYTPNDISATQLIAAKHWRPIAPYKINTYSKVWFKHKRKKNIIPKTQQFIIICCRRTNTMYIACYTWLALWAAAFYNLRSSR